ncbi:MAG: apolipoprotein N-acyltransferase [Candidatus Omnitrophica bacterium]|nr:apolipoprotein N-acyltransferase [Candidatus Omnitrophota bacterium]
MTLTLLALCGGILTGLSFNSEPTSFLIWFSLVPFIQVISKSSLKAGIFRAFLFGFAYYLVVIFWIAKVTFLGLIALVVYLSLYCVLFFLVGRYFLKKPLRLISLPCFWVLIEFLKENIWTGFGWANLGYSQYNNLHLIQVADIGGVKLISFLVVMANVFIWEVITTKGPKQKKAIVKKALFVCLIFLACFSYGAYRLKNLTEAGSLEVTVAQPNIPQSLKWDPSAASSIVDKLGSLAKETKKESLVIFPEAAWPYTVAQEDVEDLRSFAESIDRHILIGSVIKEGDKFYNSALLFQWRASAIRLCGSYRKIKLVPFGEYVPLRKLFSFIEVLNTIGDISPGETLSGFSQSGHNYSVLICFEDVLASYVTQMVGDSDFLVNITNDAWFGGNPQSFQHLGVMTLRAVENRVSIVRSANTGISGWVSFKGEIEKLTHQGKEVFFPAIKTFRISLNRVRGVYTFWGELFPVFCGMFLLAVFIKSSKD